MDALGIEFFRVDGLPLLVALGDAALFLEKDWLFPLDRADHGVLRELSSWAMLERAGLLDELSWPSASGVLISTQPSKHNAAASTVKTEAEYLLRKLFQRQQRNRVVIVVVVPAWCISLFLLVLDLRLTGTFD